MGGSKLIVRYVFIVCGSKWNIYVALRFMILGFYGLCRLYELKIEEEGEEEDTLLAGRTKASIIYSRVLRLRLRLRMYSCLCAADIRVLRAVERSREDYWRDKQGFGIALFRIPTMHEIRVFLDMSVNITKGMFNVKSHWGGGEGV